MPEQKHEIDAEGPQTESHAAKQALADKQARATAHKARHGEEIAAANDTPAHKAKKLRELGDDELLALAEQAAKAEHWLGVAQRGQADFENTIKRMRRDHEDALRFAAAPLAREMLPVLDNLARALKSAKEEGDFGGLYKGLELTQKLFADALARHGIKPIDALHKPFDPALHDAVMTASDGNLADNVVSAELEQGWTLNGRVLRAAKVVVNKKPESGS